MADLKLKTSGYTAQTAYLELHKVFMVTKLSHYKVKSFAAHEALGKTYDSLDGLLDSITEKLIGYSGEDPGVLALGSITPATTVEVGNMIMGIAKRLETFAEEKGYCDIENLAQEVSGVGAQLIYLSRFA